MVMASVRKHNDTTLMTWKILILYQVATQRRAIYLGMKLLCAWTVILTDSFDTGESTHIEHQKRNLPGNRRGVIGQLKESKKRPFKCLQCRKRKKKVPPFLVLDYLY